MKDTIIEKYNDLWEDINMHYNKVKIIDNYDDSTYTILYLNKNDSFDKFEDAWEVNRLDYEDEDYDYIVEKFFDNNEDKFDFFELEALDISTQSEYELDI